MRAFVCDVCDNLLSFENSVCVRCGTYQGFSVEEMTLRPVTEETGHTMCANLGLIGCNWLVDGPGELCLSCRLTRTRPPETDLRAMDAFFRAEQAKRRLVYQLVDLGVPVVPRSEDPRGLAFDLLSSAETPVITGHDDGLVTIDLAEGYDPHREAMRVQMGEAYRTLLGHVRHEVGHYYFQVLVEGHAPGRDEPEHRWHFRRLFGDEREDYGQALERHYASGPPEGWHETHVSAYATAHPWEDWAETFAHYLHIADTMQTASAYGMIVTGPEVPVGRELAGSLIALPWDDATEVSRIRHLIASWLPLTYALNAVNRSMGKEDLYPFLLTEPVIAKLGFVHDLISDRD